MISVQTYVPEGLSPFIKSFWRLQVSDAIPGAYEEDIIPDGHHEIIFHLNAHAARRKTGTQAWGDEPAAFFAGQTLQSYTLQLNAGAVLYGIRFYPHTLALLFKFPAHLLTGGWLPLGDIPGADLLQHCITENAAQTFTRFERILHQQIRALRLTGGFSYVHKAVSTILQQKGDVRIDELIRATGVSVKHLDNSFKQFAGVTPKTLCNIIKLNYFIRYREQHPSKTLTECAYEASFYDQSHLIRLFKAFTCQSPRAYFSEVHYINEYFTGL
ncbi:AraC family transcriptional regulator [Chitinophaga agrisoli]|uniref:AraC family transcriptional regulator n=1 Tax=Chitinophaga agrisoli TaxID=2607653 RepID=A0A5B2VR60_9BACT|nr:helix-turn-helix domain-containing protein [Chitinophaga agrisoli]KAA2240876.1 AraC family transcriptional regulator [Chitinophaga agrisoli]